MNKRIILGATIATVLTLPGICLAAKPAANPGAGALPAVQVEQAAKPTAEMLGNVTLTHYCICQTCCGKTPDHPAYGITASGRKAEPYTSVAVDPDVIPLGSTVIIEYEDGTTRICRADDTGGAVNGNHIDLCVTDHQEAWNLGKKTVKVYWGEGIEMDAYSQWMAHDTKQEQQLAARPLCSYCEEHIQDERCYEINCELICPTCLENHFEKWTEDYI